MALLIALVGSMSAAQDATDDRAADDARRMHTRVQELHQLLRERQRQREAHQDRAAALEAQVGRLEADLNEAEQRVADRRQAVREAEQRVAAMEDERRALASPLTQPAAAAERVATAMEGRIAEGVPFRRDARRGAMAEARRAFQASGDDAMRHGEGLRTLFEAAGEELRLSTSTRFWNAPAEVADGRRVQAYQVRVGLVQQMLISEDGGTLGLAGDEGQMWRLELSDAERRQVRGAAAILQQQRPPRMSPVPLPAAKGAGDE